MHYVRVATKVILLPLLSHSAALCFLRTNSKRAISGGYRLYTRENLNALAITGPLCCFAAVVVLLLSLLSLLVLFAKGIIRIGRVGEGRERRVLSHRRRGHRDQRGQQQYQYQYQYQHGLRTVCITIYHPWMTLGLPFDHRCFVLIGKSLAK